MHGATSLAQCFEKSSFPRAFPAFDGARRFWKRRFHVRNVACTAEWRVYAEGRNHGELAGGEGVGGGGGGKNKYREKS